MTMATAALLNNAITLPNATLIEAVINGHKTWLRFDEEDRAQAQGDIVAAHAAMVAEFTRLEIPVDANTRVILDVRLQLAPISPNMKRASRWSCPPCVRPVGDAASARPHMANAA